MQASSFTHDMTLMGVQVLLLSAALPAQYLRYGKARLGKPVVHALVRAVVAAAATRWQ